MRRNKIELNRGVIKLLQHERELSDMDLARLAGIDPGQIWRVKHGKSGVGTAFIAGMLQAFPELRFEDLFFVDR
jgi:hypothetical protein